MPLLRCVKLSFYSAKSVAGVIQLRFMAQNFDKNFPIFFTQMFLFVLTAAAVVASPSQAEDPQPIQCSQTLFPNVSCPGTSSGCVPRCAVPYRPANCSCGGVDKNKVPCLPRASSLGNGCDSLFLSSPVVSITLVDALFMFLCTLDAMLLYFIRCDIKCFSGLVLS